MRGRLERFLFICCAEPRERKRAVICAAESVRIGEVVHEI